MQLLKNFLRVYVGMLLGTAVVVGIEASMSSLQLWSLPLISKMFLFPLSVGLPWFISVSLVVTLSDA